MPIVDEQLLEAIGLVAKSSIPRAHRGTCKDIDIVRSVILPTLLEMV